MTITEQIAALAAEQLSLLGDHSTPYNDQEKKARLHAITDQIARLYAAKRQEDAARRATLAERGRR